MTESIYQRPVTCDTGSADLVSALRDRYHTVSNSVVVRASMLAFMSLSEGERQRFVRLAQEADADDRTRMPIPL